MPIEIAGRLIAWRTSRRRRGLVAALGGTLLPVAAFAAAVTGSTGCSARRIPATTSAVTDAQAGAGVRTALVNDVTLGTYRIDVRVDAGIVTLLGTVPSAAEAERAAVLARGVVGVSGVESALTVGEPRQSPIARRRADPDDRPESNRPRLPALAPRPEGGLLRLVGLGGSVRVTRPSEGLLGRSLAAGPLLRLRPRNGLGPTVAFNWTDVEIEAGPDGRPGLAAVQLRPVMGGVELGAGRGRFWGGVSVVAGYSFNRLSIDKERVGPGRAIAVGNSFVWRPGAAIWLDVTRRLGINVFGGYLVTSPSVTFASDASISSRRLSADSAVVSVGAAYWIF